MGDTPIPSRSKESLNLIVSLLEEVAQQYACTYEALVFLESSVWLKCAANVKNRHI